MWKRMPGPNSSPAPRHAAQAFVQSLTLSALIWLSACGDVPTAMQGGERRVDGPVDRPTFTIAEPTYLNTAYDEDLEVELLTTGELKVRNRLTGAIVYAPLDTAEMETIALLFHGLRVGDAEYEAMNALNPYENAPPGFEPFSAPVGESSLGLSGPSSSAPSGVGLVGSATAAPSVLVRRSADSEPIVLEALRNVSTLLSADRQHTDWSTSILDQSSLSLVGWDPMECAYAANSIALHRAQYLNSRREPLGALRQMTELSGVSIVVTAGKVMLTTAAAQAFIASLATKVVGVVVSSQTLTSAREVYNSHNCQQTIVVGQSLSNPTSVFPGGGTPWNGRTCTRQSQTWEVSYDGGLTWEPFNVIVEICTYPAMQ